MMHTASAHTALRSVLMLISPNACVTVILIKSFYKEYILVPWVIPREFPK